MKMNGGDMTELVYLKNDEAVCSSLQVAEKFGKRHDRVLRAIDNLLETLPKNGEVSKMFILSKRKAADGQFHRMYFMNRDGFSLLVMGFTGKKALEWKLKYIKAFNQMEKFILERQTQAWIDSRKAGKLTRKAETDTIKKLVEYAQAQGSQHADKLYMTYSKLANKMAGVSKRDEATVAQLNNLSLMEHIILCVIDSGIVAGKHYKEIYQDCKKRLETVKDLAYLEQSA
jgi:Rha family phage regulatory protein